jgi:hypothetical protein
MKELELSQKEEDVQRLPKREEFKTEAHALMRPSHGRPNYIDGSSTLGALRKDKLDWKKRNKCSMRTITRRCEEGSRICLGI